MIRIPLVDRLDRVHLLQANENESLRMFLRRLYIPRDAVIAYVNDHAIDDDNYIVNKTDRVRLKMVRAYQLPEFCRTLGLWDDAGVERNSGDLEALYSKNILWFNNNGVCDLKYSQMKPDELVNYLDDQFTQSVLSKKLINEGDTILLALSGGRDSLALLYLLRRNKDRLPKHKLVGVTVADSVASLGDLEVAKEAISNLGVDDYTILPLTYLNETMQFKNGFDFCISRVLKNYGRGQSINLWHCIMRANVERFARERNIFKLAFGYHHEDLFASIFRSYTLGVLFGESAHTKTWGDFSLISPLWAITKKELTLYLEQVAPRHHSKQGSPTDYDRGDHNRDLNYYLVDLLSSIQPGIGMMFFDSLERLYSRYEIKNPNYYRCHNCGITYSDALDTADKVHKQHCSHCSFLTEIGEINAIKIV